MGGSSSKGDGRSNVFLRARGKVGENLRRRRAFSEAREYGLQRDTGALKDGLATHNLRVTDDPILVVHYTLMRYTHFRAAAEYVAAAFAGIPTVSRVALFGSVSSSPRMEPGRARARRGHIHEPKDVDIAVWLDDATGLDRLRVLRSRAVNQLWDEKEIGVAHHQVDVFLLDAAGKYIGRLCCFNACPKHKPECRADGCGKVPFLRQHDEFVLHTESLRPEHIQVLYDRDQPERGGVLANVP